MVVIESGTPIGDVCQDQIMDGDTILSEPDYIVGKQYEGEYTYLGITDKFFFLEDLFNHPNTKLEDIPVNYYDNYQDRHALFPDYANYFRTEGDELMYYLKS